MKIKENKKFFNLMMSTVVSSLGSYAFNFAFMAHIYSLSGQNKTYMGLTQLFFVTGMLLGNIAGGPIGEKYNRKTIILLCELLRIPMSIMFIFTNNIWLLLIIHGSKTFFAGVSSPTKRAFITDIVDEKSLPTANNIFSASFAIVHIIGPLIGTWGYSYFKRLDEIVYLDLATFVISFILIGLIRHFVSKKPKESHFVDDLKEGFVLIKSRYDLRGLYEKSALVGIFSGFVIPLILPFIMEVLGKEERTYGIMMVFFGIGGVTGAVINKKVSQRFGLGRTLYFCNLLEPLILLLWALSTNYYVSLSTFFIWGMLFFIRAPGQFNYLAKNVPKEFISRTNAVLDFVFTITNITASFVITIVGNLLTTQQILIACAGIYILINMARLKSKETTALKNEDFGNES